MKAAPAVCTSALATPSFTIAPPGPLTMGTAYPTLHIPTGDTLIFFSAFEPTDPLSTPHFRVHSSTLLSAGSPVLNSYLGATYQHRIRRRKKLLQHGMPVGITFVVDLAPAQADETALSSVQKLWCPDAVRNWKPAGRGLYIEEDDGCSEYSIELDRWFQAQAWATAAATPAVPTIPAPPPLPPAYSVPRHIGGLQRVFGLLHGVDPHLNSATMWYTVYKLSLELGLQRAVVDHVLAWLYIPRNAAFVELATPIALEMAEMLQCEVLFRECFALSVARTLLSAPQRNAMYRVGELGRYDGCIEAAAETLRKRVRTRWDHVMSLDWLDELPSMKILNDIVADMHTNPEQHTAQSIADANNLQQGIRLELSAELRQIASGAGKALSKTEDQHWQEWSSMVFRENAVGGSVECNRYAWLQLYCFSPSLPAKLSYLPEPEGFELIALNGECEYYLRSQTEDVCAGVEWMNFQLLCCPLGEEEWALAPAWAGGALVNVDELDMDGGEERSVAGSFSSYGSVGSEDGGGAGGGAGSFSFVSSNTEAGELVEVESEATIELESVATMSVERWDDMAESASDETVGWSPV
jgi:hypothetical protein